MAQGSLMWCTWLKCMCMNKEIIIGKRLGNFKMKFKRVKNVPIFRVQYNFFSYRSTIFLRLSSSLVLFLLIVQVTSELHFQRLTFLNY